MTDQHSVTRRGKLARGSERVSINARGVGRIPRARVPRHYYIIVRSVCQVGIINLTVFDRA